VVDAVTDRAVSLGDQAVQETKYLVVGTANAASGLVTRNLWPSSCNGGAYGQLQKPCIAGRFQLGQAAGNDPNLTHDNLKDAGAIPWGRRGGGLRGATEGGLSRGQRAGILADAARGKGNYGLGSATARDADALGRDWVGEGYQVASDQKTLVSADGLRQYRPPTFKPNQGRYQANFERKFEGQRSRRWQGNGHLDIIDRP